MPMILTETRNLINKSIDFESKNNCIIPTSKHEFYALMVQEYEQFLDEAKTYQFLKRSLWQSLKTGDDRTFNNTLINCQNAIRHIMAESSQIGAILQNEIETLGAGYEK